MRASGISKNRWIRRCARHCVQRRPRVVGVVSALALVCSVLFSGAVRSDAQVSPSASSIDDRGNVVLNGNAFFPFGFYGLPWRQPLAEQKEAMKLMAAGGFNTVVAEDIATNNFGELLDEASTLGMYVLVGSSSLPDNQYIGATVSKYATHPAVLGWSLFDDADDGTVSIAQLKERSDFVKSKDAKHFTFAPLTGYYSDRRIGRDAPIASTDASSLQMYPITPLQDYSFDSDGNPLAESYRRMRAYVVSAERQGKAMLANAQTFKWTSPGSRYPTVAELRNMVFGQVMAGAKGILSYDFSLDLYNEQRPLFDEYAAIGNDIQTVLKEPILIGERTVNDSDPNLVVTTWTYQNDLYVGVLNTSTTSEQFVDVPISVARGATMTPVSDRLSNTMTFANGRVAGTLAAMDVQMHKVSGSASPPTTFPSTISPTTTFPPTISPTTIPPTNSRVVKIMPLGDSLTEGEGPEQNVRQSYRGHLYNSLKQSGYSIDMVGPHRSGTFASSDDPDNAGFSGYTIGPDQTGNCTRPTTGAFDGCPMPHFNVAEYVDEWIAQTQPDVITLMVGLNDQFRNDLAPGESGYFKNVDAADAPDKLANLVAKITSTSPSIRIVLGGLAKTRTPDTSAKAALRTRARSIADASATDNITYADVFSADLAGDDFFDDIHLTDTGASKVARVWLAPVRAAVDSVLKGVPVTTTQPGAAPTDTQPTTAPAVSGVTQTVSYTPSSENFANPERGFAYENDVPWATNDTWDFCRQGNNFTAYNYDAWNTPLDPSFLASERANGRSVVMSRYHIAAFRNGDISPEYLAFLDRDFATARQAGMKQIIRFAYNYPKGGPDAPLAQVLRHLDQLKPVLQRNKDVIATMEAGFIGCWGEWHSSSNELLPRNYPPISDRDGYINDASRQIMDKLLNTLPADRMLQFRYPRNFFEYLGKTDLSPPDPLTAASAYSGSAQSRVGYQDDCFVCNPLHGGSYWNSRGAFDETPNFLKANNEFVAQGGEPGDPESTDPTEPANPNSPLSSCETVRNEFTSVHWSTVGLYNVNSAASAVKRWQRDGCWDEFNRNLGYRFQLRSAIIPTSAKPGQSLALSLLMTNEGYARPYNPRNIELVLRNKVNGQVTRIKVQPSVDIRMLLPGPSETKTVTLSVGVPSGLAVGTYDVLLNLPDPEPSINTRAEFSIQLANNGVWEKTTGYNSLGATVSVG
jgi:lysophospholipase L1-like esterase